MSWSTEWDIEIRNRPFPTSSPGLYDQGNITRRGGKKVLCQWDIHIKWTSPHPKYRNHLQMDYKSKYQSETVEIFNILVTCADRD